MNKKQIWLLAIFISLITLMLIVVQVLWINNAKESKEKDFRSAVSTILDRAVNIISHEEKYTQIINELPVKQINHYIPNEYNIKNYSELQKYRDGLKYTTRSQEFIPVSELESFTNKNKSMPFMKDSNVIEFLKKDNKAFQDTANKNLQNNQSMINQKNVLVEQIIEHIFMIDLPIEQRVTIEQINRILLNEFNKSNITTNFEVAIVSEKGYKLLSTPKYSSLEKNKYIFEKQLFPDDPESFEKNYLKVLFSEKNFYILQSLWILIIVSFILTFLILATFIGTLLIIAKQKKIAGMRNAFVGNITHEFKTPIATISLAGQMLQDTNIPVSAKNIPHISQMVVNQSKKLTYLVEQVLQISIFNKGDYELKTTKVDVHEAIKKVLNNFSTQIQNTNAKVVCKFDAINTIINTDEHHYLNIISNLFDNALKYVKDIPNIKITTMNKNNGILVSLSDNGIGISKIHQKRIYEQFFRVPSGNVHNTKGFGLGLSYVKKILEIMGGQIWVQSEIDKGSVFSVWMPLKLKTN